MARLNTRSASASAAAAAAAARSGAEEPAESAAQLQQHGRDTDGKSPQQTEPKTTRPRATTTTTTTTTTTARRRNKQSGYSCSRSRQPAKHVLGAEDDDAESEPAVGDGKRCGPSLLGVGVVPEMSLALPSLAEAAAAAAAPTTTRSIKSPLKKKPSSAQRALDHTTTTTATATATATPLPRLEHGHHGVLAAQQARGSNNEISMGRPKPLGLAHVNSLLLPLSSIKLAPEEEKKKKTEETQRCGEDMDHVRRMLLKSMEERKRSVSRVTRKAPSWTMDPKDFKKAERAVRRLKIATERFVLQEAECWDKEEDEEGEGDVKEEEENDEDTDLSGFIVDDEAELSFQDDVDGLGSGPSSEGEDMTVRRRLRAGKTPPGKRRLQRGIPPTRIVESDEEEDDDGGLATRLGGLRLEKESRARQVDVVDLTYSPAKIDRTASSKVEAGRKVTSFVRGSSATDPFAINSRALPKFSPPRVPTPVRIPSKPTTGNTSTFSTQTVGLEISATPPRTPPASPTKLKCPAKPLSPSKRVNQIPKSPHRPSIDAFWSSEIINEWNDQYSPKKEPFTSPTKKGLAGFKTLFDSENESDPESDSPSPCGSPTKTKTQSPQKEERKKASEARKVVVARTQAFKAAREIIATDLLQQLDTLICGGKLALLAQSTGGVKVTWSKNLRSTAGRANWRKTVTKPGGGASHATGSSVTGVNVQHYAGIELAEKVIDNEARLVNTLAHEFCHLANFMVSGVRDQPHGASFKIWYVLALGPCLPHVTKNDASCMKIVG